MNTFYIYITDTFGGELNYCWVTKFQVSANTERGALNKVSRETSLHFRHDFGEIYKAKDACVGLVIEQDNEYPSYDYSEATQL